MAAGGSSRCLSSAASVDAHLGAIKHILYGKPVQIPRLNAWYGDPGCLYCYSGYCLALHSWTAELSQLRLQVERVCENEFNSVLANLYRGSCDSVAWHSDDEPELGPSPVMASLSLGASLRHRHRKQLAPVNLGLKHGSLLVMSGGMQQYWHHSLPKDKTVHQPRINLTFRKVFL